MKNPWNALKNANINRTVYDTSGLDMNVKAAVIQVKPKKIIIPVMDSRIFSTSETESEELPICFFLSIAFLKVARMTSMDTIILQRMIRTIGNKNATKNGIASPIKQLSEKKEN